jgi:hypothetical protein
MRRAILLLAVVVAGASGCSNDCNSGGTLTIYWQTPQGGFTSATGQLLGCDAAGVATVDVTINGTLVSTSNCHVSSSADGVQLFGFGDETVNVQVDAYSSSNEHLYQALTSTTTAFCANKVLDVTLTAVNADMNVAYSFRSGGCMAPTTASPYSTTFIWYRLVDGSGKVVSAADQTQNSTAIPCSDTNRTFVVPSLALSQSYAIDGIEEVELDANGSFIVWSYNCVQSPAVLHAQANDTVTAGPMVAQASGGTQVCF